MPSLFIMQISAEQTLIIYFIIDTKHLWLMAQSLIVTSRLLLEVLVEVWPRQPAHCITQYKQHVLTWPIGARFNRENLLSSHMSSIHCLSGWLPTWTKKTMVNFVTTDGISWFMLSTCIHQVHLYLEKQKCMACLPVPTQLGVRPSRRDKLFVSLSTVTLYHRSQAWAWGSSPLYKAVTVI